MQLEAIKEFAINAKPEDQAPFQRLLGAMGLLSYLNRTVIQSDAVAATRYNGKLAEVLRDTNNPLQKRNLKLLASQALFNLAAQS